MKITKVNAGGTIEINHGGRTYRVYESGYVRTDTLKPNKITGKTRHYQLERTFFNPINKAKGLFTTADQIRYVTSLPNNDA